MSVEAENDVRDDGSKSGNADPTIKDQPGKPSGENVPPAGGESMSPTQDKHPFATPGGDTPED